jgi:hypothetical protein
MRSTKAMFMSMIENLPSPIANSSEKTRIIPVGDRKFPEENSNAGVGDSNIALKNRTVEVGDRNARMRYVPAMTIQCRGLSQKGIILYPV